VLKIFCILSILLLDDCKIKLLKGKPSERLGRKASGLFLFHPDRIAGLPGIQEYATRFLPEMGFLFSADERRKYHKQEVIHEHFDK